MGEPHPCRDPHPRKSRYRDLVGNVMDMSIHIAHDFLGIKEKGLRWASVVGLLQEGKEGRSQNKAAFKLQKEVGRG